MFQHRDSSEKPVKSRPWLIPLLIFILAFSGYYLTNHEKTPYDHFVRLADALIHGNLYLPEPVSWLELIPFNGKYYILPPPMPAVVIVPLVFLFGQAINQTLIVIFFGSINVVLAYLIAKRILGSWKTAIWVAFLFGFGTIHWWAAAVGGTWTYSHVLTITFLFLAIYEALTRKRLFLVGLLLGAAFWCRLQVILSLPFFIIMLWEKLYDGSGHSWVKRIQFPQVLMLAGGISVFVLLNFAYNYARFGTIFDKAYELILESFTPMPGYEHGLFSIKHMPAHLNSIFRGMPTFVDGFPYVKPHLYGIAIWITTPAFIYALFGWRNKKIFVSSFIAIISIAVLVFSYLSTGVSQFGYRYALDFYPFLFLLTCIGMGENPAWHAKLLILLSFLVNLWAVIWIFKIGL